MGSDVRKHEELSLDVRAVSPRAHFLNTISSGHNLGYMSGMYSVFRTLRHVILQSADCIVYIL